MSPLANKPILDRLELPAVRGANPSIAFVPITEHVQYLRLVDESIRALLSQEMSGMHCIVDSHTAKNSTLIKELASQVGLMMMVGDFPPAWASSTAHCEVLPRGAQLGNKDHFFIVISGQVQCVLLGTADIEQPDRSSAFVGGWTIHPEYAAGSVQMILPGESNRIIKELDPGQAVSGSMATTAIHLMALQSGDLAAQQEGQALDKADLFSVLNILKAISARRRAQDVLFVFVEQIARVVSSDRCSIVRVWGRGNEATVLASHEDATFSDHRISLDKYPELQQAIDTRDTVVIQDTSVHPLVAHCREELKRAGVTAVLVIPIVLFDDEVGTLLLRAARKHSNFTLREMSFFEIVAEAAANALERAHLLESVQAANERLEHIARTDGLTGLYNRRYFHEQFNNEFERARRYQTALSCMIFDVDNFKQVNDNYGHLIGDSVLVEIANRLQRRVRSTDLCARYGGEEFVVLMPQTDHEGAERQAERVRATVANAPFDGLPSAEQVSISVGVSVFDEERMRGPADLLRAADNALYEAKSGGKNQVVMSQTYGEKK
ncbi:MAG: diguanylate cyclase [Candidatus Hydrogenedens sp.]|nr:diguanylate cyclase [Candidatus Hydrogenedens sp.]